jgi:LmbE family N-acetylglucosaminyl deacetylase
MILVISPHFDDAAFSLAATLKLLAAAECPVRIINCFTMTEFAPFLQAAGVVSVTGLRREEEAHFAAMLGRWASSVALDFVDAPGRTGLGVRGIFLRHSVPADTEATIEKLVADLEEPQADVPVLAPLAVGGHIDHYISRQAAIAKYSGFPIAFYEDLPYAARNPGNDIEAAAERTARALGTPLRPIIVNWTGSSAWKERCCSLYASQISEEGIQRIVGYLERIQGERLWCSPQFLESSAGAIVLRGAALAPGSHVNRNVIPGRGMERLQRR